jgi:coproporphyrinogen III oxidase
VDLVKEAGLNWVTSYFEVAEKRQQESYDSKDVAVMDSVRARILEFYLLKDFAFRVAREKLGVPLEVQTLGTLPPTIRY